MLPVYPFTYMRLTLSSDSAFRRGQLVNCPGSRIAGIIIGAITGGIYTRLNVNPSLEPTDGFPRPSSYRPFMGYRQEI